MYFIYLVGDFFGSSLGNQIKIQNLVYIYYLNLLMIGSVKN